MLLMEVFVYIWKERRKEMKNSGLVEIESYKEIS